MTKKEIQQSLEFYRGKVTELKDWLIKHHTNPIISTIANDVRHFEDRVKELEALDLDAYPTLEEAKALTGKELLITVRTLRKPRNEQEKEIHDLIYKRIHQYAS